MTMLMEDTYPSRVADRPQLLDRADPIVYGGDAGSSPLSEAELQSYEADGYLFVDSLFGPEEVTRLNQELCRMAADANIRNAEETITEPGGVAVRSIFHVHKLSPVFDGLARDARVLDVARQILGSEVYLHQSRVNFKPGFSGKEFYWHSDFETWHQEDGMPRMRALSVSIALTENYPFNGPLMVIPGSHKTFVSCVGQTPRDHYKESLKRQQYGVPDHDSLRRLTEKGGIAAPVGPAGSAVIFDCNTMHGSNGNITPYPRSNAFFVYNSVENTLREPFCGLKPRPEHIAAREDFRALQPVERS